MYSLLKMFCKVRVNFIERAVYDVDHGKIGDCVEIVEYVCLPGRRLIFCDGVYRGWYRA